MSDSTFTDRDGDTYEAVQGGVDGWELIDLSQTFSGSDPTRTVSFFVDDAEKIIELIQSARKGES